MKQKFPIRTLLLVTLFTNHLYAQKQISHEYYINNVNYVNQEVCDDSLKDYSIAIKDDSLTSNATLNTFFATKISIYLSEASDLSLSRAYAVLDNSDGRLFLGTTFPAKQSKEKYKRLLFTGGIKANVKDGFASLFGTSGFNNDMGISFKTIIFGRGSIWFNKDPSSQKNKVINKRKHLVNEALNDFDNELSKFKKNQTGLNDSAEAVSSFISDYIDDMRQQFSTNEAAFIMKKHLYNSAHTWWISSDVYFPVTQSIYKTVPNFITTDISSQIYRPYELNVTYTNFWDTKKLFKFILPWRASILLTIKGSLIANNSVTASLIDSYSFDKYLIHNTVADTVFLRKLKSESIYVGNFEKFITPRVSGRFVYMPVSFIGISAALEKSFGKIDDLNWRLGIPISLKDNEGKQKINFELVWKEISKEHSIGLSIGLPIGTNIF